MKLTKHDLGFILKQIQIAEANSQAHAGANAKALTDIWVDGRGSPFNSDGELYEAGAEGTVQAMSSSLHPYGLRTVDGSYNNFIVDREMYGASGQRFERLTEANWVEGTGSLPTGYPSDPFYETPGDVVDSAPRTISNLIVDQTPDNPAAIITALQHAGYTGNVFTATTDIQAHYALLKERLEQFSDPGLQEIFKDIFYDDIKPYGIEMDGLTIHIPNVAPDDGISASYNAFFAAFGQFFDHGLDLVAKGGNGTVYMPLQPDDPLYVEGSHTNFMAMTRVTIGDEARNITTPLGRSEPKLYIGPFTPGFPPRIRTVRGPARGHGQAVRGATRLSNLGGSEGARARNAGNRTDRFRRHTGARTIGRPLRRIYSWRKRAPSSLGRVQG